MKKTDSGRGPQLQFRKSFKIPGANVNSSVFGVLSASGKKVTEGDLSLDLTRNGTLCANGIPGFTAKTK